MDQMTEKIQENEVAGAPEEAAPSAVEAGAPVPAAEPATTKGDGSAIPAAELERLRDDLIAALKTVFDPEIPVDIYELGLIYRLDVDDDRNIEVDMTLTAPGCPVAGDMPGWVENAVSSVPGVGQVKVKLVFDPPWDMTRMSEEARLALNMF
jgi:FeS assembly SUF system protein